MQFNISKYHKKIFVVENSRGSSLDGSIVASKDLSLLTQQIEMLYNSVDEIPDGTGTYSKRSSLAEQGLH